MNDFIGYFSGIVGVSPLNAGLSFCIFLLVRQRYEGFQEEWKIQVAKMERLEKSVLIAGIPLLELED